MSGTNKVYNHNNLKDYYMKDVITFLTDNQMGINEIK